MTLPPNVSLNKGEIQRRLLEWYQQNKRDFPWRRTKDGFAVLLAEKLLQQTRVRESVVNAYNALRSTYPSPESLWKADPKHIETLVAPLGLKYRAAEIQLMCKDLIEKHNGKVPAEYDALIQLTGVGEYCARATLSFAFGEDVAVVDTNVARFLHRLCGIDRPLPANPARKKYLQKLADELLPEGEARQFNLAVLDFCALVCKPGRPLCERCPIRSFCAYGSDLAIVTEVQPQEGNQ